MLAVRAAVLLTDFTVGSGKLFPFVSVPQKPSNLNSFRVVLTVGLRDDS